MVVAVCVVVSVVLVEPMTVNAATGADIVAEAKKWLGYSYGWAGDGGVKLDCSGLVQRVYAACGYSIPRLTYDQAKVGTKIAISDLKAGDICCFSYSDGSIGHVGIYVGNNQMIHAPGAGRQIEYGSYISTWTYSGSGCKLEYGRRLTNQTSTVTHTHSYDVFRYYGGWHPHYAYYQCSYCDDIKAKQEFGFLTSCSECMNNHTHTHDKYLYYGGNHPHYCYYECRCGEIIAKQEFAYSSTCKFCVNAPGKPVLRIQDLYSNMDNITFKWDSTNNTTHYNLYIKRLDQEGIFKGIENIFYAESGVSRKLAPGYYYVILESKNSNYWNATGTDWLSTFSDYYYFNVIDIESIKLDEGKKYVVLDEPMSWYAAEKYCELLGGHLATIESEEENAKIHKLLQDGTMKYYWIGATDAEDDEIWKWINGTQFWEGGANGFSVNSEYVNWGNGEPNGGKNDGESNYACIYKSTGMWDDTSFNHTQIGVVCEFEEITPVIENDRYMIFDEKLPWHVAKKYCETLGGHLVTIESAEENKIIYDLIQDGTSKYYWIGGTDAEEDENWKWINGTQFWKGDVYGYSVNDTYVNWGDGEPNGGKNDGESNYACIYRSTGKWDDTFYKHTEIGFICEIEDIYIKPTVKVSDTIHRVETKLFNNDKQCEVIVAGYKNGQFVDMKNVTCSNEVIIATLEGDLDEIKILVWGGTGNLSPLCKPIVIPQSEWVIE